MLKFLKRVVSVLSLCLLVVGCGGKATIPSNLPSPAPTNPVSGTASSKNGNVTAYYTNTGGNFSVNVTYNPSISPLPQTLTFPYTINPVPNTSPIVAIDDTGNIVLIIQEAADIKTYNYISSWNPISLTPAPTLGGSNALSFAFNVHGGILTITTESHAYVYQLTQGNPFVWTQILSVPGLTAASFPQSNLNPSGQGVSAWTDPSSPISYVYTLDLNTSPVTQNSNLYNGFVNTVALALPNQTTSLNIFLDSGNNLWWSLLEYATFTPPVQFNTGVSSYSASVDPSSGNVLLTYSPTTPANTLYTQTFNLSTRTWSTPSLLATDYDSSVVTGASSGLGAVAWTANSGTPGVADLVKIAVFDLSTPSTTPLADPGIVSVSAPGLLDNSLAGSVAANPYGTPFSAGVLIWTVTVNGETSLYYSLAGLPNSGSVNSPTNFKAKKIKDKFLTQTDLIASLTWAAPIDGTPVSYIIFKNGVEIANVPANQLSYKVHGLKYNRNYTFGVSAVSSNGTISTPATANLIFKKK